MNKSKKATCVSARSEYGLFSSKRSQGGVFGMSFGTIWGIILIIFFIVGAFFAIRIFLDQQKCASIGMFFNGLQNDVNRALNSEKSASRYNSSLPSGSEYVCFMNVTANLTNANNIEAEIYNEVKNSDWIFGKNAYLYAPSKQFCINWDTIKHINLDEHNPICIQVVKNKVSIKVEKRLGESLVRLSA